MSRFWERKEKYPNSTNWLWHDEIFDIASVLQDFARRFPNLILLQGCAGRLAESPAAQEEGEKRQELFLAQHCAGANGSGGNWGKSKSTAKQC